MKPDIETRQDIYNLLEAFYAKALNDEVIGHFFTQVKKINMDEHLPVITDFWEMVLLGGTQYKKNAITPHIHLHQLSPMTEKHFTRWLELFHSTVDELYEGPNAFLAKQRAVSIATVMKIKVLQSSSTKIKENDNTGSAATGG